MTTHSNYSLQNFSTNNAKVLTGNSQPVPDFMALCNQGIISRENISGIDNSNGNLISHEKILGIDNSNLPLENKEEAEAEAKAKGKEVLTKENLNLIKIKLMDENKKLHHLSHSKEKIDITKLQRYIEIRHKTSRKLYAKTKSEIDQTRHKELDSSLWARTSKVIELIILSKKGLQKARSLYKKLLSGQMCIKEQQEQDEAFGIDRSKQGQGIVAQDGKSSEQQEQEELFSLKFLLFDFVYPEPGQGITTQDGTSLSEQEQEEVFSLIIQLDDLIKSWMTAQNCKSQESYQKTDRETDQETIQETDQKPDQKPDQETDQEENQNADQEIDQEKDQEIDQGAKQEVDQQAYQQADQQKD